MSSQAIRRQAETLRQLLAGPFELEALDRLADFADQHAVDRPLFHRALLLRREVVASPDPASLAPKALELLERIVENAAAETSDASEKRKERVRLARAEALDIELPRKPVLRTRKLGKSYRSFALRGVDLELRAGEITGVVGRNAHGKTTLLRILAGELKHDKGRLDYPALGEFQKKKIHWAKVKRQLAYLPQDLPEWHGSLRNNIHFEAAIHGIRGEANEREVDYILERLELTAEITKTWNELSGGTKLRCALARALVFKPRLLVLDEPLANLDFKAQQVLLTDLRHLVGSIRYPLSIVISSQHLHEVEAVSDRLVFLREGRVLFNGPREDLGKDRPCNTFELDVGCGAERLQEILSALGRISVIHSGVRFIVETPLEVEADTVLGRLLGERIKIEYFRDISRSTKVLFDPPQPEEKRT